jgi:hypothetical protein
MKRIYLSGPMTGLPQFNFPAFHAEAARLRAIGLTVVNPAEINAEHPGTWAEAMRADLRALLDCDTVALLPGWQDSRGAKLELQLAHALGMQVLLVAELQAVVPA